MWHFNAELKQYVSAFDDPDVKCQGCDFAPAGDREALVKHVAYEHDKLNELLGHFQNDNIRMIKKRQSSVTSSSSSGGSNK